MIRREYQRERSNFFETISFSTFRKYQMLCSRRREKAWNAVPKDCFEISHLSTLHRKCYLQFFSGVLKHSFFSIAIAVETLLVQFSHL